MRTIDSIKPDNKITVTILSPDGSTLFQATNSGYHNIEQAVVEAVGHADLKENPKDCVFEITNHTTDVTHRYRINAHGNLKLIV